jgi:hypothetical protein
MMSRDADGYFYWEDRVGYAFFPFFFLFPQLPICLSNLSVYIDLSFSHQRHRIVVCHI